MLLSKIKLLIALLKLDGKNGKGRKAVINEITATIAEKINSISLSIVFIKKPLSWKYLN